MLPACIEAVPITQYTISTLALAKIAANGAKEEHEITIGLKTMREDR